MTRSGRTTARIAILTRYPEPGAVKTRLASALGEDGAAELHRALAAHCVQRARPLAATREARIDVWYEGGSARDVRRWLGRDLSLRTQWGGDLGDRLRAAFDVAFAEGAERVAAIGSDCPGLDATHLRDALSRLDECDVVLGPTEDGGYYLVAARSGARDCALDALFGAALPWGTDQVLECTLARLDRAGLSYTLLATLRDVDRPEDLPVFERVLADEERVRHHPSVSVVIPTLNEAPAVARAISSALEGGAHEVIVVDGRSEDATREVAQASSARVVTCTHPGRASQMNYGAAQATGDALVFLHADTVLPPAFGEHVCATLARPGVVAGAFDFAIDEARGWRERLADGVGRMRSRATGVPYGDQGLFLMRETFEALGGFPDLPVMEDWEFVQRLKRLGRIGHAPASARTSPRGWREHGLLRPTAVNLAVIAGYRLGIDPESLAEWRRGVSASRPPPLR